MTKNPRRRFKKHSPAARVSSKRFMPPTTLADAVTKFEAPSYLVVLNTHTKEKIEHYNTIARLRHLPFRFVSINRVEEAVHSAEEDTGSDIGNAIQKADAHQGIFTQCQRDPRFLKKIAEQENVRFAPSRVVFVTEDSQIRMKNQEAWNVMREWLSPMVSKEVLDRADSDGKQAGPGAETGPIASAVGGWTPFVEMMRKACLQVGLDSALFTDEAVFTVQRLSEPPEAPLKTIKESTWLSLASPNLSEPLSLPEDVIHATRMLFATPGREDTPNAERWHEFLPHESVRSKLLMALFNHLKPNANLIVFPEKVLKRRPQSSSSRNFKTVTLNKVTWDAPTAKAKETDPVREEVFRLLTPCKISQKADAVIFPPLTEKSEKEQDFLRYLLHCRVVENSLEAHCANQVIIVQNDGSWTNDLKLIYHMANVGMHGDHLRPAFAEKGGLSVHSRVSHVRTCYMDVLEHPSLGVLNTAAQQVLSHREQHYTPYVGPRSKTPHRKSWGTLPPDHSPTVAYFVTASNGNKVVVEDGIALGRFLAEEGANFVWGGGDSHGKGMWAPYYGYRSAQGQHVSGVSVPTILKIESAKGRMPDCCNFAEINKTIYGREATMHRMANGTIVAPGGIGTYRELVGKLLLMKYAPDLLGFSPVILHSPDIHAPHGKGPNPYWVPAMRVALGDEKTDLLLKDHTALAGEGIFFSTSLDETKALTRGVMQEWRKRHPSAQQNLIAA